MQKLKSYMMPVAMALGIIFYDFLSNLGLIIPYLVSIMLFISYCNLSLRSILITRLHIILVSIQVLASAVLYIFVSYFDTVVAQGVMICVLAPTATSAIVITGMLGGNTSSLASYSLLSNLTVAILAPIVFSVIGNSGDIPFWKSFFTIFEKVFIVLLLPFILSLLLYKLFPQLHGRIRKKQAVSFYLWGVALALVTARTVKFILGQDNGNYKIEVVIAMAAFIVCAGQFLLGRRLGKKYNDTIAGGQGLGQKNTVLAIWMAQTYLAPISSIGPGAYILWQNIINSYQVWRKQRIDNKMN